ncbi:hypothetical protein JZM24_00645 [Candidatus Sodalis endolongispinus]|uniref:Phage protein n=1 Tax=Candidatus Sodalis endolongispinus TaxID=2812662 RepID=A0ABS5Y7S2_9GAMM|nr:hypothetical protein [Candidatus Sodalis endolongispinus]MBT9431050.1 hypothetical protein [Candidatus Sodalis endolongispinus]
MNGVDFIHSALVSFEDNSEASMRNVTSRCYYGLYHISRHSVRHLPKVSFNHHKNLINYLNNSQSNDAEKMPAKTRRLMGRILKQERSRRNEADYNLDLLIYDKNLAEVSLEVAKRFLSMIEKSLSE